MKIYISGISGTAMGALALFAKKAGIEVFGSDKNEGAVSQELRDADIKFSIGEQDGNFLRRQFEYSGIDWFVYTSALPENHPELLFARQLGIKVSKRDELINYLIKKLNLKMVAVAGTHGKTTTTAMIIWTCLKLGLPVSWLEGTTLGFASAGEYNSDAKYLIYEADEYDRNFLAYQPWVSAITVVDYDHPDIYPTKNDYIAAFEQFKHQSEIVISGGEVRHDFRISGEVRRKDAELALEVVEKIASDSGVYVDENEIVKILNNFPGSGRRFERIARNVYSDYAHHPEEIKATIDIAREEAEKVGAKGVIVVYEPHQNTRQHEIFQEYHDCFSGVDKLFWLPTFLTRENSDLRIIEPREFIDSLDNSEIGEVAELNESLAERLKEYKNQGFMIVLLTAGPADAWLRELFGNI